jgi:hypothetical protein
MNPGDRVSFRAGCKPAYLAGVTGTLVKKQPDEPRWLVKVDNDPRARKYAGGTWCCHVTTIRVVETTESYDDITFELVNTDIDTRAQQAVKPWLSDIAELAEASVNQWASEHETQIDAELWHDLYRPALLWRFYAHLGRELERIGEGHEELFYNAIREGR